MYGGRKKFCDILMCPTKNAVKYVSIKIFRHWNLMDTIMTIDNFTLFYILKVWQKPSCTQQYLFFISINYFPLFMLIVIQFCKFCLDKTGRNRSRWYIFYIMFLNSSNQHDQLNVLVTIIFCEKVNMIISFCPAFLASFKVSPIDLFHNNFSPSG